MANGNADEFYIDSLKILKKSKIPFMVGGTYAVMSYVGIDRPTKDMDVFCKAGDYPKILHLFSEQGYKTENTDERWLAKVKKGRYFFDVIYNSANAVAPVTDEWFKESQTGKILDINVNLLPPTELIFSKVFVQDRYKFDGNDIAHLILLKHKDIKWERLLSYLDQYWEVLLGHVLHFRFVYPSEREIIPRWLLDELLNRLNNQINLPTPNMKVCRGRIFSFADFEIDVKQWGFADLIGDHNEPKPKQP
jgi:uncharacterized protein YqkB